MTFQIGITLLTVLILVVLLYKSTFKPAAVFLIATFFLIGIKIVSIEEFLSGLANKQIIIIFLLVILTNGIQQSLGSDFFFKIFNKKLSLNGFRLRMMLFVGGLSSLINNTPIVAFMIPYVKKWADERQFSASPFLIPLSYATILGGMITVVGTSTNLVLNGLIDAKGNLPLLGFFDFFWLGCLVMILGTIYLYFFSDYFLPKREGSKQHIIDHIKDYIVEVYVDASSEIVGKTISEAGLRHLKEIFLVEIKRGNHLISAVGPDEIIAEGDMLFFAGRTEAIFQLIQSIKGLRLPEYKYVETNKYFKITEAIIPSGSNLVNSTLKESNFRDTFNGSVISIYRNGKPVAGNLGEIVLEAGDFMLMLTGKDWKRTLNNKDLVVVSFIGELSKENKKGYFLPSLIAFGLLLIGISGIVDLFLSVSAAILVLALFKLVTIDSIKQSVDIDLLIILVCSLAIGIALTTSGSANYIVDFIFSLIKDASIGLKISILFILTVLLTSLITNAAAVSIMFPIALSMSEKSGIISTPFFVAIAFAASCCFLTPIGYQTNLMVMGPGNYQFKDYFKIGLPLTVLYTLCCLIFINYYYNI